MVTVRHKPNFKGGFRTWYVNYNVNREQSTIERFVVFSSGRRQKVMEKLWLKLVWDELTKIELKLFLSMTEVLNNDKIVGFLRAILEIDKRTLRQRLIKLEQLFGEIPTSRERYKGFSSLSIEIQSEIVSLSRGKKFSGYVRNIASIGSGKRGAGEVPEPIADAEFKVVENIDWYSLLSVGEISLLSQRVSLPDEDTESVETESNLVINLNQIHNDHQSNSLDRKRAAIKPRGRKRSPPRNVV